MSQASPNTPTGPGAAEFEARYECKYLVSEATATVLRDEIAFYLELDDYCATEPGNAYLNTSLYFDSPDHLCYRSTAMAARNRFKLRARWYRGDHEAGPFLEEKRRADNAITKHRAPLRAGWLGELSARHHRIEELFADTNHGDRASASYLGECSMKMTAQPACYVRYWREAWLLPEGYLRVTFDTQLEAHVYGGAIPSPDSPTWLPLDMKGVIFEVKFERATPSWLGELVRRHGLFRRSIPKYMLCMDALARDRDWQHAWATSPRN